LLPEVQLHTKNSSTRGRGLIVVDQGTDPRLTLQAGVYYRQRQQHSFFFPTSADHITVRLNPSFAAISLIRDWDRPSHRSPFADQEVALSLFTTAADGEIEVTFNSRGFLNTF
jgi:hypothetical protein